MAYQVSIHRVYQSNFPPFLEYALTEGNLTGKHGVWKPDQPSSVALRFWTWCVETFDKPSLIALRFWSTP